MFVSPRNTRGGKLVLFWRESVDISVKGFDKNHIDTIINKNKEGEWRFIGFYGEPDIQKRVESWDLLRELNQIFRLPWLCVGDFNELVQSDKILGGNRRTTKCNSSGMQLICVVLLILGIQVQNLHGANTTVMGIRFGKD